MANAKPLWLFDLDNTLHNASHAIFPAINVNMNAYIAQVLQHSGAASDAATVNLLRHHYWQRYGATLMGMVRHHQVRAEDFLHAAHRFEHLAPMIRAERGLVHFLKRLPGRKILFTNGPQRYARQVLAHLGLQRHFAHSISIEMMQVHRQLRPKPSRQFLRKLLAQQGIAARRCILVEDTLENLKAAKQVGMRTAWLTTYLRPTLPLARLARRPAYVDFKVASLQQLARRVAR